MSDHAITFVQAPHLEPVRVAGTDVRMMGLAIDAGFGGRRTVSPRPSVGAVVVTQRGAMFSGATEGRSGPHAEVNALARAGEQAVGATLYVTLEPCAHHGATPPCADAVIDARVTRVVVAVTDPDPRVAGRGIDRMRAAGIDVEVGVLASEVEVQLAPYLKHRRTGRPHVVLKLASTLDGRTAAADGTSRWITGDAARVDAHRLRADSDAILVGAGTVRADDPSLTVRLPEGEFDSADHRQPQRVVLGEAPRAAKVHPCLQWSGDLGGLLDHLGEVGVLQLMVEGGATVAHHFHTAGLVDRYVLYLAPALFGGHDGAPLFRGGGASTMADIWRGRIESVQQLGADLRIDLTPSFTAREGG